MRCVDDGRVVTVRGMGTATYGGRKQTVVKLT